MDDKPRVNIGQVNTELFKEEEAKFFVSEVGFKSGYILQGIIALGYLRHLYYLLPAARYIKKDEKAAKEFVDTIDDFTKQIRVYYKQKNLESKGENPNVLALDDFLLLDDGFDTIVRKFYMIMHDTGFSP